MSGSFPFSITDFITKNIEDFAIKNVLFKRHFFFILLKEDWLLHRIKSIVN